MIAEVWREFRPRAPAWMLPLLAGLASIPWYVVMAVVVVGAYAGLIWWGLRDFGRGAR